jgi:hypothetical protein
MSVQDSFERAVAGAAAAALAEQRLVREAAERAVAEAAVRQGPAAETAALLERFRRAAATKTANVKAVVKVQNWRGKWIDKHLQGWRVSGKVSAGIAPYGTYSAFLMLDTDGGLWIYNPEAGMCRPWQLGQLPFVNDHKLYHGNPENLPGELCEGSIVPVLGSLAFQFGVTL